MHVGHAHDHTGRTQLYQSLWTGHRHNIVCMITICMIIIIMHFVIIVMINVTKK